MQDRVKDIVNTQIDDLLVRGARIEMEVFERLESVLPGDATTFLKPNVPDPLEQPQDSGTTTMTINFETVDTESVPKMPSMQSRSAAALLQLKAAIKDVQV
jgi:hypothetical protein